MGTLNKVTGYLHEYKNGTQKLHHVRCSRDDEAPPPEVSDGLNRQTSCASAWRGQCQSFMAPDAT